MPGLRDDLISHVNTAVFSSIGCIEQKRQSTAPKATGQLARSIRATYGGRRGNTYRVKVRQNERQAPHGPIINNPKARGGRIFSSRPGGFLRFEGSSGDTVYRRSVKQSTVHKDWWDDFEWIAEFEDCLRPGL